VNAAQLGARLHGAQTRLRAERAKLDRLEGAQARAQHVLARQLVDDYEGSPPDVVNVVIEATGFGDMVDRIKFAHDVQTQDARVVDYVRRARRVLSAEAIRVGALDAREQRLAAGVRQHQNALARARLQTVEAELAAIHLGSAKAVHRARVRGTVASLEQQLAGLEAVVVAGGSSHGGPARPERRGFTFPLPKMETSPASTWSSDQGVDISAPGNTPEYAVCSGTIVLHGIGGFGPWAPVIHCDQTLAGYSYVYYGHAGPLHQLPIGTHVSAGQVMSSIGPGIVGLSSGPHLELGFADSSGSPIGDRTAGTMLSLLRAVYGG
jgi:murein DD-endopeptidase MepM/ murein hydrolase activator NlpD